MGSEEREFEPSRLGEALRRARLTHPDAPTLKDVATRVGVSVGMIGNVETGIATPSAEVLIRWLTALELPAWWADEWIEWRAVEESLKAFESLPPHLALPPEELDMLRRNARNAIQARRRRPR